MIPEMRGEDELYNNLMFPDGTRFYPDSQNGKYGFNTDPQRGADTFRPFSVEPTLYGTYTGDKSVGIPDNLTDKNFLLVSTNCRIVINAGDPSGTGEFTFAPTISKSGNTLSITGCSGTKVGVIKSLNAHWYVTYNIYYY